MHTGHHSNTQHAAQNVCWPGKLVFPYLKHASPQEAATAPEGRMLLAVRALEGIAKALMSARSS
jgi:hypothetical protein